jgi:hypothetical protein
MEGKIMTTRTTAEEADHLSRRRARMLPFLAVIYLSQQASFFASARAGDRPVDHVKIGAWVVLSLVLLAALTTKGFWLRSREVRDMIDDETTRAHRGDALGWGFIMATLTAIALYFVSMVEPLGAREAIHIIVSLGLAAAIIRFGMLERRAYRDA